VKTQYQVMLILSFVWLLAIFAEIAKGITCGPAVGEGQTCNNYVWLCSAHPNPNCTNVGLSVCAAGSYDYVVLGPQLFRGHCAQATNAECSQYACYQCWTDKFLSALDPDDPCNMIAYVCTSTSTFSTVNCS
jgi:hypothetical protein